MGDQWKAYIDGMVERGALQCGLFTIADGVKCSATDNFNVSVEELRAIKSCVDGTAVPIAVNGNSCIMISSGENAVIAKTKADACSEGKILFHCELTSTLAVIIGKAGHAERAASGIANFYADHLRKSGY